MGLLDGQIQNLQNHTLGAGVNITQSVQTVLQEVEDQDAQIAHPARA